MMTRKDYVAIATALKDVRLNFDVGLRPVAEAQFKACVYGVAGALAGDNPRFDRDKFVKACGL